MRNHRLSAVLPERELDPQLDPAPGMFRETPISMSSESDSLVAVAITFASDSAQTISSDRNPGVALVFEIITVPEDDDQRSDTIGHVDSESDGLEVLEAEVESARSAKSAKPWRSLRRHDVRAARTRLLVPCVRRDPFALRSRLRRLLPSGLRML